MQTPLFLVLVAGAWLLGPISLLSAYVWCSGFSERHGLKRGGYMGAATVTAFFCCFGLPEFLNVTRPLFALPLMAVGGAAGAVGATLLACGVRNYVLSSCSLDELCEVIKTRSKSGIIAVRYPLYYDDRLSPQDEPCICSWDTDTQRTWGEDAWILQTVSRMAFTLRHPELVDEHPS